MVKSCPSIGRRVDLAFSYRKHNPGSGGSRPGAGRFPEISKEIRYGIGKYCYERYAYECQEYNLKQWFDYVIELWHAANPTAAEKEAFYNSIHDDIELTNQEIAVFYYFCFDITSLYNENAVLDFKCSDCKGILQFISDQVFGFPTELPEDYNLPREKIRWTKKCIMQEAQLLLLQPDQIEIETGGHVFDVSMRFIQTTWEQYFGWMASTDFHSPPHSGDN